MYVILDIYSRYVVGWMVAHRETAELAEQLIADTIDKQNIVPGTLTLHADQLSEMYIGCAKRGILVGMSQATSHAEEMARCLRRIIEKMRS